MRIVILTSNRKGTASYCLPVLLERAGVEVVQVICNQGVVKNKSAYYRQKFRKILKIGLFGAINGVRMRKWFSITSVDGKPIEDIEDICRRSNIPFAITAGINTKETMGLMTACAPDLGLSLGNSYIASKVFSIPHHGMVNIHGEILPKFQNAQSVIWQLYEGQAETGYTIHKVEKKIDTGHILKQERFPILFGDTLGQTVTDSCTEILKKAAAGLAEVVSNYELHERNAIIQTAGTSYTTPSLRQFLRIHKNFRRLAKARAGEI
jgi:methionyl-tRNA formyltransferase